MVKSIERKQMLMTTIEKAIRKKTFLEDSEWEFTRSDLFNHQNKKELDPQ